MHAGSRRAALRWIAVICCRIIDIIHEAAASRRRVGAVLFALGRWRCFEKFDLRQRAPGKPASGRCDSQMDGSLLAVGSSRRSNQDLLGGGGGGSSVCFASSLQHDPSGASIIRQSWVSLRFTT